MRFLHKRKKVNKAIGYDGVTMLYEVSTLLGGKRARRVAPAFARNKSSVPIKPRRVPAHCLWRVEVVGPTHVKSGLFTKRMSAVASTLLSQNSELITVRLWRRWRPNSCTLARSVVLLYLERRTQPTKVPARWAFARTIPPTEVKDGVTNCLFMPSFSSRTLLIQSPPPATKSPIAVTHINPCKIGAHILLRLSLSKRFCHFSFLSPRQVFFRKTFCTAE